MNKKLYKIMKEQNRITKNGLVKCNCGRCVKFDNIEYIYPIDINCFNWWNYEILDNNSIKIIVEKWYGYIGYVPILREIPYYLHKWFHKKIYVLDIECKYCEFEK